MHNRSGHPGGDQSLIEFVKDEMVHELYYKMGCENDLMELENEPCAEGKAQHTKFPREENTRD